jgi:hypothetical protein
VAFTGDDLVLELAPDGGEIGIVTGDTHQEVAIVLWVNLGIAQQVGIDCSPVC